MKFDTYIRKMLYQTTTTIIPIRCCFHGHSLTLSLTWKATSDWDDLDRASSVLWVFQISCRSILENYWFMKFGKFRKLIMAENIVLIYLWPLICTRFCGYMRLVEIYKLVRGFFPVTTLLKSNYPKTQKALFQKNEIGSSLPSRARIRKILVPFKRACRV